MATSRRADIESLLSRAETDHRLLSEQAGVGAIDKVTLKNTLENLRSALDYAALDIAHHIGELESTWNAPTRIYFPYGRSSAEFKSSISKSLPQLDRICAPLFECIEALQPFRAGDNWLVDLCELTNSAKHDQLSDTSNRQDRSVTVPGFRTIRGNRVGFFNNTFGGEPLDDFIMADGVPVTVLRKSIPITVNEKNVLVFSRYEIPVDDFLRHAIGQLRDFVRSVYEITERQS